MSNTVSIRVPEGYEVPDTLSTASPDVAALLISAAAAAYDTLAVKTTHVDLHSVVSRVRDDRVRELENERDALILVKRTTEERVQAMRDEERRAAQKELDELRDRLMRAHEERMRSEHELSSRLQEMTTERCGLVTSHASEVDALKARIAELTTPASKGRAGEVEVARILSEAGFDVTDTSTGEAKENGYLDLLATRDDVSIAIEVKNVATVQKCDRDAFERKVRDGVTAGKFSGAAFVSLRASTKRPHVLDVVETASGFAPVSWLGGTSTTPLIEQCIDTHVTLLACVAARCRELRVTTDEDESREVQTLFEQLSEDVQELINDMAAQQKLLDDLRSNLTRARARCVHLYASAADVNRSVDWLRRPAFAAPWFETFEMARARSSSMEPAKVWNHISNKKALIERTIGKDAMFQAIGQTKRKRDDEQDV